MSLKILLLQHRVASQRVEAKACGSGFWGRNFLSGWEPDKKSSPVNGSQALATDIC